MPFFTTSNKSKNTSSSPTTRSVTPTTTTKTTSATPNPMVTDTKPTAPPADQVPSKDAREFEHGRQKAKKSARTQAWREEKARARRVKAGEYAAATPPALATTAKRTRSGFHAPGARSDWDDEVDADDEWMRNWIEEEAGEALDGSRIVRSESGRLEVDLTNLMKPAKPRKAKRGMSSSVVLAQALDADLWLLFVVTADSDFEVLPSVRQVVVLDDRLDGGELEADEPWEHLDVDGEDEKAFSYAEVAAIPC
ncbi:hypothetical protein EIP91_004826 [Steccherinum ochraceum]|uniref:Uncharacterized protein n=1 Tax=Steccherinum ochraceum TaxID=92696 RepID=A0A4V2MXH4_9APHY|nr:hypothetical protein EIP91_004826 [Steccherinum ochraceum]